MRLFSKKTGENRIKLIFTALKQPATLFTVFNKQSLGKLFRVSTAVVVTAVIFIQTLPVQSAPLHDFDTIGTLETIKIYPAKITASQWAGYEQVLAPDLGDDALYQEFSASVAAYVTDDEVTVPQVSAQQASFQDDLSVPEEVVAATTTEPQTLDDVLLPDEPAEQPSTALPTEATENNLPPEVQEEEPVSSEPAETVEEVPEATETESSQPVSFRQATESMFAFFSVVTDMLPFAQVSGTTTVPESEVVPDLELQPEAEVVAESEFITEVEQMEVVAEDSQEESAPEVALQATEVAAGTTSPSSVPSFENTDASTTAQQVTDLSATQATTSDSTQDAAVEMVPATAQVTKTISLSDFSTEPLEPGEFIKNMQLRASFAGTYDTVASGTMPYVEFVMRKGTTTQPLGTVLLDGEVSNALNGGYFLFGFPQYEDVAGFEDITIDVVYHGPVLEDSGVYLDALWLEVDTEIITKEDLYKRTEGNALGHLNKPEKHEFISTKKDFTRAENPVFNIRYTSQRNKVVSAVRDFLGAKKVKVQDIKVKHKGAGEVGVRPDVTVTKDGIISVAISDDEKKKMKPGQYTVELVLNEGGVRVTDSFDFQWGILAINTNKTEYSFMETATVSLGAITPSGNTLCNANLRLYVIDPRGNIESAPVEQSGQCNGNNVTDVPDYASEILLDDAGQYELYLERLADDGSVIGHTGMVFNVVLNQLLSIDRNGPTRIFPPSPYPMELTVYAENGFSGTIVERVPNTFAVSAAGAEIEDVDGMLEITWDMDLLAGKSKTVSYTFDAPDLSPFLYELGPAELISARGAQRETSASSSATTTKKAAKNNQSFAESRQWEIASDATGNMILFWDGGTIPADWACLSCGAGVFFNNFMVGSSSYDTTIRGVATHTPTASGSVLASAAATTEPGTGGISTVSHTHTYAPTIGPASNLPLYRELQVIQYTASAGEPATIPAGAIAVFDAAVPAGWTRYSAHDGYYVRGGDTPLATGGANEHTHAITGTTGNSAGGNERVRGGGTQALGAADPHTHTVSTSTPAINHEPPFIEVVLGQLDAGGAPVNGIISMWTDEVPAGWLDVSTDEASPFNDRFIKASTTYSATGGATTHTHADMTGIVSSGPSATVSSRAGSSGSDGAHTHDVSVTGFSTDSNLPPHISVIYGKRQGTDPVYEQLAYRWYANEDAQTPTDAWPVGGDDLLENERLTATGTPVESGDEIRLRISAQLSNATSTAGTAFKLQYAEGAVCSAIGTWFDVGDTSSSTQWRGYDNASVAEHSSLSSTTLSSTTVAQTYQENGFATSTPNEIPVDDVGEWDFVLEHNGATAGTQYCFRMVEADGSAFASYTVYPQLFTNQTPVAPTLQTPFDNEKASSTLPVFTFVSTDPEGDTLHYQIQIDDDYLFGSPLEDKNTIANSSQFNNLVDPSSKAPYPSGFLTQFDPAVSMVNGVTYWYRVRAQDSVGSDGWGQWSTPTSYTIDTALVAAAWFQTTQEQFDTNTLVGVQTLVTDEASLIVASTTGSMTSPAISFDDGLAGTAWDRFEFTDSGSTINYTIEYLSDAAVWAPVPDSVLSGNSAGLTTSPVSLLNLDTSVYSTLRLVANYTTGGTPEVQDWGVYWGYRVEIPTITKPFTNEKVATTTPIFEFSTTDPQNDSLTYQISWSTDNTFTSSTTRTSEPATVGFTNIDSGVDTDPFNSGDTIQYEIQPADALTDNTTYWWRVRAKDTLGDNAWSFWTEPQSFTASSSVVVSTWFQTTQEQFDTNILSGTLALSADNVSVATTAAEALIVYGEGTASEPRFRQWNGSEWDAEGQLSDIGSPLVWAEVQAGTTREEYIAATVGTDADVNAQVFTNGEWASLQEMTTNVGNINAQGFDLAYETLSGDAMVAYCDGDDNPSYYIWNGSTWTLGGTITLASTNNCEWLQLASNPTSDEIIVLARDDTASANGSYEAQVWNGTAWGNSTTFGRIDEEAHEGMTVAYEEGGTLALILSSNFKSANFNWSSWNGTTWSAPATQGIGNDFEWGTLVSDTGSDDMALCYQDEDTNIGYIRWNGTTNAWVGQGELLATVGKSKVDPGFSCVFENGGSRDGYIMTAYTDLTQTNYSFWNNAVWSTGLQLDTLTDTITSELVRTGDNQVLGLFFDETNDSLRFSNWNGTIWATTTTLENNASVDTTPYGRPYGMGVRNDGKEGTTIASPGINFTDGTGPYWEQMSWVDVTPGTSDILYSVQYYDGSAWNFIPDGDLAGNESGTSVSPIDLSGLNKSTYSVIRPYASLTCDGSGNCPVLEDWTVEWAEGLTVSGTLQDYTQTTDITGTEIRVAVNGVVQSGKSDVSAAGVWSIANVTVFPGDVVTVFAFGEADASEAVGVTRYDGFGDISGFNLYERHLALGSNDATSTPLTNADIGLYDVTNTEDVFFDVTGTTLTTCGDVSCGDVRLFVNASTTYTPFGNVVTHDVENNGTLVSTSTLYVDGSWLSTGTTTLSGGTVVMSATSTTESISTVGAAIPSFGNLTFGTTTGNASWTLANTLDVDGNLTVARGTLSRGSTEITVAGNLLTQTDGFWTGIGTTTFDGGSGSSWGDTNPVLQNVGTAVIDGAGKIVTLSSDVAAESILINADDTLDASIGSYDVTTYGNFINNNSFVARNGSVLFAATTTGTVITAGGDSFYDVQFTGVGGAWSFTESELTVANDFTIATGTVTMPTATTSLAGSFSSAGGTFAHNNSVLDFTGTGIETITASGTAFTNAFYDLVVSGSGSWTFLDQIATTSNDVRITGGTLVLPETELSVAGSFLNSNGTITANSGSLTMTAATPESITLTGSSLFDLAIAGSGAFTMTDTVATVGGDVLVLAGSLTLPADTLTVGGSWQNNATINALTGTVLFDSVTTGESIDTGSSVLHNMVFDSATGGWSITQNATSTASTTLAAGTFTLNPGATLSVGGVFTNTIGGASTTWTGSTLSLENGTYSINGKTDDGDVYDQLRIEASADVSVWSSSAAAVSVAGAGSFYSQDNAGVDGDLYIYGSYGRTEGGEYWSYATDFDGTSLGTSSRQANVRLAAGASVVLDNVLYEVLGVSAATSTVSNQTVGTYTIDVLSGTTTAQYYDFSDLGTTGVSLLSAASVTTLDDGAFTVAAPGGTALTIASSTIDANIGKQIYGVQFATTTAITAFNVTQSGGAPASFWWFRDSSGNLDGEVYDVDTGDPGSVRWDDSSLVITVAGTVFSDAGVTAQAGGMCDDVTNVIRVVVEGGATYDGVCSSADGSYSIGGVVVVGDPTLTIYVNDVASTYGSVVTKTPTADITNADIYLNRVIVRHEDVSAMTIADMAAYDSSDDADVRFTAATSTLLDTLSTVSLTELYVWASTTFTPDGTVTLNADSDAAVYDGSLYLAGDATFTGAGTTTYSIGGSMTQSAGASFVPASSTVVFTATTTGKTITADETVFFNQVQFTGVGGGWNLNADLALTSDLLVSAGTVTGTGDITLQSGSFYGNGLVSLGAGTTTIATTNTLGGTQGWTFNNLTLGNGLISGTTTPGSIATTTVGGVLTIETAHFLNAGSSAFNLTGAGEVFIENGNLVEGTSTFIYSGTNDMEVLSTDYYNLVLAAAGGTPTYTATGLGVQVFGDLGVGGAAAATVFTLDTEDPAMNVEGDLSIAANGTLIASDTGAFTVAGSYDNSGTFTANSGTLTFDGVGAHTIAAGDSVFASVLINGAGSFTVSEHATSMTAFVISENPSSFTLASGQTLAVTGSFVNNLGGAATTWTGSEIYFFGGGDYLINPATTTDSYDELRVGDTTQIRMWNSDAVQVTTEGTGSLYAMDYADTAGDLYVYGSYVQSGATDHWSYQTDFDGTDLTGGAERKVDVYIEGGGSVTYRDGGDLSMLGVATASTTVQNQGAGTYSFVIGNAGSTTMNYYEYQDADSDGLTFTGIPSVADISYGSFLIATNGDSAITVGGDAITANPARTFTNNVFATSSGVSSAVNVTATGTSLSSWRFTNHTGAVDGETFDVDPDGDPGYVVWDDSAASITIAGNVYSDEGVTASAVCDGVTNNVHVRVAGLTSYTTTCNVTTGAYAVTGVTYSPGDALVAYIDGEAVSAATVTEDPVSNINNMDLYENRVIVRHEGIDPISISDMSLWDSSDDADIPFTAVAGTPDTLTLPADTKLIVWNSKEFEPNGTVTVAGAGAGAVYDGTVQLFTNAVWTANGSEEYSIGGSFILDVGATFDPANSTTTFTTTESGRTVDINESGFYNVRFSGSGSWSITDATLAANDLQITAGTVTLPTGTSTISGSFVNNGGSFVNNGSPLVFDSVSSGNTIQADGSDFAEMLFTGSGAWTMTDTDATSTASVLISSGTLTLPAGTLALDGSFRNEGGVVVHNSSELIFTSATTATLLANGSDLGSVRYTGAGAYTIEDADLTFTGDVTITSGTVTFATGTMAIGGSFDSATGNFDSATGTLLFNSSDAGETVNPGNNTFYNVVFGSGAGGWTIAGNATTTNNFTLSAAADFTLQSGTTLYVANVFDNSVGGSATTWSGSTLVLNSGSAYAINAKSDNGDQYDTLRVTAATDIEMWSSAATTTVVAADASLYSQDNAGIDGDLYIYGDYHIGTTSEYWSYATDFDGTDLTGGAERQVTVAIASGATTTVDGGSLSVVGALGNETTITNQGSGTYTFIVSDGTFSALYYAYRNLDINGLQLTGTPVIGSLSEGDFELVVDTGVLVSLASSTLNANASKIITGVRFATTTAISGTNVSLSGVTSNAWTFISHTGNLGGEAYDIDGGTLCGSLRWDDSACLLTQQTHYRWRNDDGNIGVPDDEWYNTDWNNRKRVRVENTDASTYTDAVVKLSVTYDADMQPDFDDVRFTSDNGTSTIPFWVERFTASTQADIWVQVPELPANDIATVFMYYDNAVATSTSSSTETFIVADDFEDGDIVEYAAVNDDKNLFTVDGSFAYGGSFGLDNTGDETSRADDGGIYNTGVTVSQGEIIRYLQYVDVSGGGDEVCTLFAVQSASNNYAVCLEQVPGDDRISIAEDVTDADTSGTILSSSTVAYTTGWYEVEIDWQSNDDIDVTLSKDGSVVTTVSANDASYTSGGIGFTYWFNSGGWDNYTSRPRLDTEPTIYFGAEQTDGGATWISALDTPTSGFVTDDTARLRIQVENSGLQVVGQTYQLEYAGLGAAPSCEAVSSASYAAVPVQASCGSSPVCMQNSTNVTDGEAVSDLLRVAEGTFTPGELTEDPANTADALTINQNQYTELEYVLTPTVNVVDENLCFRVTNSGADLDTYLRVAQLQLRFDPSFGGVSFNGGQNISLLPGTTTRIYASSTVTDLNGFADITLASSTMYTTAVGAACAADDNNCYITNEGGQCSFTNCAGNSCVLECYADYLYHADATDADGANAWLAFLEVEDAAGGYAFATSPSIDVNTLRALDVSNLIDYGALAPSSNTGASNASTTVQNLGNDAIDVQIIGDDLADGFSSTIPANQQIFSTSTFDYTTCTNCTVLATTSINYEVDLSKPVTSSPPTVDDIFWGIAIPFGVASNPHTGNNTFFAIGD